MCRVIAAMFHRKPLLLHLWVKLKLPYSPLNLLKNTILALCASLLASIAHAYPATVAHVTDGDTLQVCPFGDADTPVDVRLYGIDAPEKRQEGGGRSAAFLRDLLPKGSAVEIVERRVDKYGRAVALVYKDGLNVNAAMLKAGHAWYYAKYCRGALCGRFEQLHDAARERRCGLWRSSDPVPPWNWRKKEAKN